MNTKRILIATAASGLVMWVVAGLWHNLIMASLYAHRHAAHDGIWVMLTAYLVLGAFMSVLYSRLRITGHPALSGALFGAFIGVLWVFPHELAMVGAHGEPLEYVFKNAAWHAVEQAFGGLAIGLILKGTPSETTQRV